MTSARATILAASDGETPARAMVNSEPRLHTPARTARSTTRRPPASARANMLAEPILRAPARAIRETQPNCDALARGFS